MRRTVLRSGVVVFVASFCTLVVELVAGRVLAPYVGVSLYTWTSIIGVVLAGISGGAWAGGWLADRRPAPSTLGFLLLASGAAALLIVPATTLFAADDGILTEYGIATTLLQRVVVLSFLLFFLPAFCLGMISPVAVKLAVRDLDTAGRVVGRLYALSTLGSIAGTFTTGFYLVATFGTRATLIGTGITLIVTALVFGGLLGTRSHTAVLAVLAFAALHRLGQPSLPPPEQPPVFGLPGSGTIYETESAYYTIRVERGVRDDTGAAVHELHLDHLAHSFNDPVDPYYLEYGYLEIFNQVAEWKALEKMYLRMQFVGGGGYTLPRLFEERFPSAEIDVIEIDPAVTRVAERYFGVRRGTYIRTVNEDARWFSLRNRDRYDLIFVDAFNDLSVPYHLTTREYTATLERQMLPGGVLVANLVDDFGNGRFLASYARTLQSVFGKDGVAIVVEDSEDLESTRSTFVVVASERAGALSAFLRPGAFTEHVIAGEELERYIAERRGIVLTDDFAPVDNMLAPLFAERFVDEQTE